MICGTCGGGGLLKYNMNEASQPCPICNGTGNRGWGGGSAGHRSIAPWITLLLLLVDLLVVGTILGSSTYDGPGILLWALSLLFLGCMALAQFMRRMSAHRRGQLTGAGEVVGMIALGTVVARQYNKAHHPAPRSFLPPTSGPRRSGPLG